MNFYDFSFFFKENMVITEYATNMDPDKLASVLKCPPSSSNDDRLSVYKTLAK